MELVGLEPAPGGVNVLMGDGSCRFVKETIDSWPVDPATGIQPPTVPGLWQALSTRNGGEPIPLDEI